jgi:DNA polymerase III epsilon subunit-like protein
MNEELLRFNKNQKYLIFDYETCNLNLNHRGNKPWQLGFLLAQGNRVLEKHDFYLGWDDLIMSKEAERITRFSRAKYDRLKQDSKKCLDEFEKYLYNEEYLIVGHNILGFDVYIHNIHRVLLNLKPDYSYIDRVLDTNCLARGVKNEIAFSKNDSMINYQYKLLHLRTKGIKTNLKQLCKDYSLGFDESKLHEALYDVEKTFEVLNKILWQLEI